MTLILAIMIIDNSSNEDLIFASDGRKIKYNYDKNKKVNQGEDTEKIMKLTPKICIGYAGKSAELFRDVYKELKNRLPEMREKDFESVSDKLKKIIKEMLNIKEHKEVEDKFGPLSHKFVIGGANRNNKLRLNYYFSGNNFEKKKYKFHPNAGCLYLTLCPDEKVKQKVDTILNEKKGQVQNLDEIEKIIRYVISEAAKLHPSINDHVFIRRLSRNFN